MPILVALLLLLLPPAATARVWLDAEDLRQLPDDGPAWEAMIKRATRTDISPCLADQDDPSNVATLALALYATRADDAEARDRVREIVRRVPGTERGARTLALGRELAAYVIAADLVGLPAEQRAAFERWLRSLLTRNFQGRTLRSTHEDRPNNWGTHAGASRLAVAIYLEDREEIERSAHVFRGWLGDADGWQGFEFGDTWWQPAGSRNYAINPPGSSIQGHSVDGVLPDDQRRAGAFRWPPPKENYVYEALQGALTQALLLEAQGYDVWSWGDAALLRAFRWLQTEARYPARGDDTWMPHVINHAYGVSLPAPCPATPGKGLGFTDWIYGCAGRPPR
ncbi:MAG: alginate lyase family protein [Pseudomonadales bacterium]